jgi:LysR family pca operon transcriptional activator
MTESNVTLLHKLRHGEIDIMVGRIPEREQAVGFNFEPLYHESQLFVVKGNHPLLGSSSFSLHSITDYPFVITGFHESIRQDVERFLSEQGIPLFEPSVAINNPDLGRHLLSKSDAIWCTPRGVVEGDLAAGTLVELPIDTSYLRATIGMTTRADQPLEGINSAFAESIRAAARELADPLPD